MGCLSCQHPTNSGPRGSAIALKALSLQTAEETNSYAVGVSRPIPVVQDGAVSLQCVVLSLSGLSETSGALLEQSVDGINWWQVTPSAVEFFGPGIYSVAAASVKAGLLRVVVNLTNSLENPGVTTSVISATLHEAP